MSRQEPDVITLIKDILCSISVMNVPVDDQYAFKVMMFDGMVRRQCDVIEQAESHRFVNQGMMTRRTDQAQRLLFRAFHHGIHGREARSRRPDARLHKTLAT